MPWPSGTSDKVPIREISLSGCGRGRIEAIMPLGSRWEIEVIVRYDILDYRMLLVGGVYICDSSCSESMLIGLYIVTEPKEIDRATTFRQPEQQQPPRRAH